MSWVGLWPLRQYISSQKRFANSLLGICIAGVKRGLGPFNCRDLKKNYNSWNDIRQKVWTQGPPNYTLDWTKIHLKPFIITYLLSHPSCEDIIWHPVLLGETQVGLVVLTAGILKNNYNSWNDIRQKVWTQRHANYTLNWTKIHLQPFMMNYWLSDPPCVDNIWHLILSIWRTTLPAARVQKNNINLQIIDIIDYSHNATLIDVQFG